MANNSNKTSIYIEKIYTTLDFRVHILCVNMCFSAAGCRNVCVHPLVALHVMLQASPVILLSLAYHFLLTTKFRHCVFASAISCTRVCQWESVCVNPIGQWVHAIFFFFLQQRKFEGKGQKKTFSSQALFTQLSY